MLAVLTNTFFPALLQSYKWYDYPGIELWKFINLAIFAAGLTFVIKKMVIPAMAARAENIRRELARAKQEKEAAEAKLSEVEARLARLNEETAALRERARVEAGEEIERIRRATEQQAEKLRELARRDIEGAGKAARLELRRFAAEESVRIAEELIKREIRPEDDLSLIDREVAELGASASITPGGGSRR
jgi:F0F1-type ATP synthase membrane subunit b/b'